LFLDYWMNINDQLGYSLICEFENYYKPERF